MTSRVPPFPAPSRPPFRPDPPSAASGTPPRPTGKRRRFRFLRFLALLLGGLVLLWAALALALPPTLVKNGLEGWLEDALNAQVAVGGISLNPFTLRITVTDIRVPAAASPDSETLLAMRELDLAPGLRLVTSPTAPRQGEKAGFWAEVLALRPQIVVSLRAVEPVLDIAYLGNGVFSFSNLLPPAEKPLPAGSQADNAAPEINPDQSAPAAADAEEDAGPPPPEPYLFALNDLTIEDGTFILRDKPLGMTHTISRIHFSVPFIAPPSPFCDPEDDAALPPLAAPKLSALLDGTPVDVGGSIRPVGTTLRTTFEIHTGLLEMSRFGDYLSRFTPLKLVSGRAEPTLTLVLSQPQRGNVDVELSGTLHLEDLEVAAPGGETAGRLKRGEIVLAGFTLSERRVSLEKVELDGLYLMARRDKNGRLDWQDWFAQFQEGQTPEEDAAPSLVVEGADLTLRNADFVWEDAAFSGAGRISVTGVDGRIAEYSTRPGARTAMRLSFGIDKEGVLALEGQGTVSPPTLQASLVVQDLSLVVLRPLLGGTPLADVLGRLDMKGSFRVQEGKGVPPAAIDKAEATVRALSFGRGTGKTPAVDVQSFAFKVLSLDTASRRLSLASLAVTAPRVRIATPAGGVELYIPGTPASTAPAAAVKKGSFLDEARRWKAQLGAFTLDKGKLFRIGAKDKAETLLSDFSLSTGALALDPKQTVPFILHSQGARNDTLDVSGSLRPSPLKFDARVKAAGVELDTLGVFLQPWSNAAATGQAEGDFNLSVNRTGESAGSTRPTPSVSIAGELTLRNVRLSDVRTRKWLGQFRRFTARDVRYASAARSLEAAGLLLDRLRLPLIIDSRGKLVLLSSLLKEPAGKAAQTARPTGAVGRTGNGAAGSPAADPLREAFSRLNIGTVRVQDASLFVSDRRFTPVMSVAVQNFDAVLTGLSTTPGSSAGVTVSAQLGGSPIRLTGKTNPLLNPPTADLTLTAGGVDLSRYSPYARQYMGYPIDQGRLTLTSRIVTSNRDFSADSTVTLQKLVLGPKDNRPGAPDYPVTLGLSLLADHNGDISLNVPLRGRLDNVNLQMGGIVGKALGGLFGKILTSPFSLVGGLFGFLGEREPELQLIPFSPGSAALSRSSAARVDKVVDLLRLRPKGKARLIGLYEAGNDTAGLKRMGMLRRLQELKHASLSPAERKTTPVEDVHIPPQEYNDLLFRAFKDAPVDKSRRLFGQVRKEDPDVMERKLEELSRVTLGDLETLARARAAAVRAAILKADPSLAGRVSFAPDRDGRPEVRAGGAQVEIQLR